MKEKFKKALEKRLDEHQEITGLELDWMKIEKILNETAGKWF